MALRTIVQDGDPILKKVCRPVTKFDDRLGTLLDDMKELKRLIVSPFCSNLSKNLFSVSF